MAASTYYDVCNHGDHSNWRNMISSYYQEGREIAEMGWNEVEKDL